MVILNLGPRRPTNYDVEPEDEAGKTAPIYERSVHADGSVRFDDYYLEYMVHTHAAVQERAATQDWICVSQSEQNWLYDVWDGTEDHYNADSYKARLRIRVAPNP